MAPIVRFAPSPTGLLHIGNARTALLNALFARREGGTFVLRLDDTDVERSRPEFAEAIGQDLAWLGISPDRMVRQSDRFALYNAATERLKSLGRLYPAFETPDELERKRRRQLGRGLPPIYDRAALELADEDRARLEAEGRRPHWRFRLDGRTVAWTDLVRGEAHVDCASLSDPVLVRADGTYLYTAAFRRGRHRPRDHPRHPRRGPRHQRRRADPDLRGFGRRAARLRPPQPPHHRERGGVSKRLGHLSLQGLRAAGIEPLAVAALAVLVGSAEAVRPVQDLDELARAIDFAHISRAPAKFDEHELEQLNARLVHGMDFAIAAPRWRRSGSGAARRSGTRVRTNLVKVADAAEGWPGGAGARDPGHRRSGVRGARRRGPAARTLDGGHLQELDGCGEAATGAKGRQLFMPLRRALTARDHGPELGPFLPVIVGARLGAPARAAA
jgi:glutamyl-tRNA synthetase